MTTFTQSFAQLSNHDLLELVKRLAADERQVTARPIASLMEVGRDRHEPGPPVPAPSNAPAVLTPLAPERYKVQFTVGRETYEKLRRAQGLLRHTFPTGDPAAVIDRALTVLLTELERTRLAATGSAAEPPSRCALRRPRSPSHASHPRCGEADRLGARRGAVRLCREHGALRGDWLSPIPPSHPVREGWSIRHREHRASMRRS